MHGIHARLPRPCQVRFPYSDVLRLSFVQVEERGSQGKKKALRVGTQTQTFVGLFPFFATWKICCAPLQLFV